MMVKLSKVRGTSSKPWIIVGGLLSLLVLFGVGGCGTSKATSAQPTSQGQLSQGQRNLNPAMQIAMEIRRLQSNQENALTSEQKDQIKPIIEELISTANPSQEVLQQKADAINSVLTDQQKSFLTERPNPQENNPTGNNSDGNNSNRNNSDGNNRQGGTSDNNQTGRTFNLQNMYQQALDSLK
ncbi:MAG: hypothetical protein ACYDEJ_05365 [Desulfitobacteriaceae bacterium]